MGKTIIQKIFQNHSNQEAEEGTIVNIEIDARAARDFGGANVVKNLKDHNLTINDPNKTFFTFDCNPGGSDQKYAANQHICRQYARTQHIPIYDITSGIGTHLAIEKGLIKPGGTFVSTDSHANIMGAIGAFGQGMGDRDIASVFAHGKIWFKVPPTIKIILKGNPQKITTPKDIVLKMAQHLGANGLLGYAAEIYGDYIETLPLSGRITIASMTTEMGGIIMLFPPNQHVLDYYKQLGITADAIKADPDAPYAKTLEIDITNLGPQLSKPGHPEDVIDLTDVQGTPIDSGFIGSCTNGRIEDLRIAAEVLKGHSVAPGRILKIVPATNDIWKQALNEGLITTFKEAGALVGNAGCAGCAAGQIGQTGPGEIAISTGNRNFVGKQGKGDIYLASPAIVAASLIAGHITTPDNIPNSPSPPQQPKTTEEQTHHQESPVSPPLTVEGKAWIIDKDNIDTDMIYHNRYLTITNIEEMGQYTFDNLPGYEDFSKKAQPGDIIITGKNFGCGSSRQQAVDCFKSLGISLLIAKSFGSIYERNAINSAMPILTGDLITTIDDGDHLKVDLNTGTITNITKNTTHQLNGFSEVQKDIYLRGDLLNKEA